MLAENSWLIRHKYKLAYFLLCNMVNQIIKSTKPMTNIGQAKQLQFLFLSDVFLLANKTRHSIIKKNWFWNHIHVKKIMP